MCGVLPGCLDMAEAAAEVQAVFHNVCTSFSHRFWSASQQSCKTVKLNMAWFLAVVLIPLLSLPLSPSEGALAVNMWSAANFMLAPLPVPVTLSGLP